MTEIHGPVCPNHLVALLDCHNGIGICPISGVQFTYQADEKQRKRKLRVNAMGQLEEYEDYDVKEVDGGNGG